KNRYSVVAYYTRDLVYERLGPGLLKELESKSPKNGDGHRPSRFRQWLTDDVGDPLLAQHLHSLVILQRLALANGHGWHRLRIPAKPPTDSGINPPGDSGDKPPTDSGVIPPGGAGACWL
ncbi:MAG TPA: P63C domain-containing protein, partial [Methyloceanibacter sp.]|nr:P63C domain-containing protein [Methyloceanibacter sp.]